MSREDGWKPRLVDLSLEAIMVVFAVILALNVENWRENRQLEAQADRIEEAVVAEIRANLGELEATRAELDTGLRFLQGVVESGDASRVRGMGLVLPDFSSAAWLATESSPAAATLDYDWRIEVSRAYETYGLYSDVAFGLLEAMSPFLGRPADIEEVRGIFGRYVILVQLHEQLTDRLTSVLDAMADNPGDGALVERPDTPIADSTGA